MQRKAKKSKRATAKQIAKLVFNATLPFPSAVDYREWYEGNKVVFAMLDGKKFLVTVTRA